MTPEDAKPAPLSPVHVAAWMASWSRAAGVDASSWVRTLEREVTDAMRRRKPGEPGGSAP